MWREREREVHRAYGLCKENILGKCKLRNEVCRTKECLVKKLFSKINIIVSGFVE